MIQKTLLAVLTLTSGRFAQAQDCITDLTTIFDAEAAVADVSVPREYVLCPDTVFDVGTIEPGVGITGGQSPIIPRSNVNYTCGVDGSVDNNCVLRGGSVGVATLGEQYFGDTEATNVIFRGIAFEAQTDFGLYFIGSGNYHFQECVVRNNANNGPVFANSTSTLEVTFKECLFTENNQIAPAPGVNNGIVTIIGNGTFFEIDDTILFANTYGDIGVNPNGYGISVDNGAGLVFKNSCMIGNLFSGPGPLVLNEETFFVLIGGYVDQMAAPLVCPFPAMAARFRNAADRRRLMPQCIDNQVEICQASIFK